MNQPAKLIAMIAVLLSLSTSGWAEQNRQRDREPSVSERDAARIVRDKKGGKVLGVQRHNDKNYRVKTLDQGRVRVYGVDGRTGEIRE